MKKMLFALNNMNVGGTEKAFLNLVSTLSPDEYDVTLLLLEKTGGFLKYVPEWVHVAVMSDYELMKHEIMDPPIRVVISHLKNKMVMRGLKLAFAHLLFKLSANRTAYYRIVLKGHNNPTEYDTAIAYCGPFDFLTVYTLFYVNAKKKIQWIHFDVSKFSFNTKACKRLYKKFDQINVVSEQARNELLKKIPTISNKTVTTPNVVSEQQCKQLAEEGQGYTDDYDGVRILTVGRLSEEKGQDIIPEIVSLLRKKGIDLKWYLVGDGNLRDTIKQKCDEYGVADSVVLLGTQENPYPFLKNADIYVQTSLHEGFCITITEARVFLLPIVSTECAGAHEQLDGRKDCMVVERSAENIYNGIVKLITNE